MCIKELKWPQIKCNNVIPAIPLASVSVAAYFRASAAALFGGLGIVFHAHDQQGLLGLPLSHQRLHMWAYVSLGSHGEYAQEQLTIYAGGAPTFSEREAERGRGGVMGERRRENRGKEGEGKRERGLERARSEEEVGVGAKLK